MCERLVQHEYIELDTEFICERHYYANLALIQICANKEVFILDPLALESITPLDKILKNSKINKIMHSPQQDKEVLMHTYSAVIQPIFDTQLAAAFLDYAEQASYQQLVKEEAGKTINKLYTRSNWLQRPLSDAQLAYAAEDVIYLKALHDQLKKRLQQQNKLAWFEEESKRREENVSDYPIQFLKNIENMPEGVIFLYQNLMQWREKKAQRQNIPRQWIVGNACIKKIVEQCNKNSCISKQAIKQSIERKRQSNKELSEHVQDIYDMLCPIDMKALCFKRKPRNALPKNLPALMDATKQIAKNTQIASSLLATKHQLVQLAQGKPFNKVMSHWRQELLEKTLQPLL